MRSEKNELYMTSCEKSFCEENVVKNELKIHSQNKCTAIETESKKSLVLRSKEKFTICCELYELSN
ncbi:MAG: hypothetical protein RR424_01970 [Oscillospiraceae bacterium]